MNAQLHLIFPHLPIALAVTAFGWTLAAFLTRRPQAERAGLMLQVLAWLSGIPSYLSGEQAEEAIEKFVWFEERIVEAHEEASIAALAALFIAGVGAAAALFMGRTKPSLPRRWVAAVLVTSLVAMVLVGRAGHTGGQIRHTEVRDNEAGNLAPDTNAPVIPEDEE